MSVYYRPRYYWIPRQQTVIRSDGRKVVTTRFGPRDWTRTTTRTDGSRSVERSTSHGPMDMVVGVAMLAVLHAAYLGMFSIPIYLVSVIFCAGWLRRRFGGPQAKGSDEAAPGVTGDVAAGHQHGTGVNEEIPNTAGLQQVAEAVAGHEAQEADAEPFPLQGSRSSRNDGHKGGTLNRTAFEQAIRTTLRAAADAGRPHVDITSRDLHRSVGGYPGPNHRMPVCCSVMYGFMKPGDIVVDAPPSGQGAKLTIRYRLSR
jgi:hypothetical protein